MPPGKNARRDCIWLLSVANRCSIWGQILPANGEFSERFLVSHTGGSIWGQVLPANGEFSERFPVSRTGLLYTDRVSRFSRVVSVSDGFAAFKAGRRLPVAFFAGGILSQTGMPHLVARYRPWLAFFSGSFRCLRRCFMNLKLDKDRR